MFYALPTDLRCWTSDVWLEVWSVDYFCRLQRVFIVRSMHSADSKLVRRNKWLGRRRRWGECRRHEKGGMCRWGGVWVSPPQPTRGLGEHRKLPNGVWDGAPAASGFMHFTRNSVYVLMHINSDLNITHDWAQHQLNAVSGDGWCGLMDYQCIAFLLYRWTDGFTVFSL